MTALNIPPRIDHAGAGSTEEPSELAGAGAEGGAPLGKPEAETLAIEHEVIEATFKHVLTKGEDWTREESSDTQATILYACKRIQSDTLRPLIGADLAGANAPS